LRFRVRVRVRAGVSVNTFSIKCSRSHTKHDNWLRTVFEGRLEGKCPRERKRIMMLDDIKDEKT